MRAFAYKPACERVNISHTCELLRQTLRVNCTINCNPCHKRAMSSQKHIFPNNINTIVTSRLLHQHTNLAQIMVFTLDTIKL